MEEKKKEVPYYGCIDLYFGKAPEGLPKFRIIKRGNKNKDNAPIEVKRRMQSGVRTYGPGESIDWQKEYS